MLRAQPIFTQFFSGTAYRYLQSLAFVFVYVGVDWPGRGSNRASVGGHGEGGSYVLSVVDLDL